MVLNRKGACNSTPEDSRGPALYFGIEVRTSGLGLLLLSELACNLFDDLGAHVGKNAVD